MSDHIDIQAKLERQGILERPRGAAEHKSAQGPSKPPVPPTIDPFWDTQISAYEALLLATTDSINGEIQIQASNSNVVGDCSLVAYGTAEAGNNLITAALQQLSTDVGNETSAAATQGKVTEDMAAFQALQSQVGQDNQNNSNITQAGGTEVSNMAQALSNLLSFANVVNDNNSATSNNIASWAGS